MTDYLTQEEINQKRMEALNRFAPNNKLRHTINEDLKKINSPFQVVLGLENQLFLEGQGTNEEEKKANEIIDEQLKHLTG